MLHWGNVIAAWIMFTGNVFSNTLSFTRIYLSEVGDRRLVWMVSVENTGL